MDTKQAGQPDQATLEEIVQRIVAAAHPLRIILFGSAARGEMGKHSDIDVLVVMPEGTHRLHATQALHRAMRGVPAAVDIVVTTPGTLERYRNSIGLVYREALRDGRQLYAA